MRAAVVVFPGSNADQEMLRTLRLAGFDAVSVWHKDSSLPASTELVALPGGFSYGDYLRCGAICRASPILPAVRAHAARGGLVLGVCNGFQILTEVGMLPGALTRNAHLRFECSDVWLTPTGEGPFTRGLPKTLALPIAHAEGRYHADHDTLARLEGEGLVAFRYCDADGVPSEHGPNGSVRGIAGVYGGPSKNVLGLMPHPERRSEVLHGGADGKLLFDAAMRTLERGLAA